LKADYENIKKIRIWRNYRREFSEKR